METRPPAPPCSQAHYPFSGCSCDPGGTLGGVAECQRVSLGCGAVTVGEVVRTVLGLLPPSPLAPRALANASASLTCAGGPARHVRMASLDWTRLTTSAAAVSAHVALGPWEAETLRQGLGM